MPMSLARLPAALLLAAVPLCTSGTGWTSVAAPAAVPDAAAAAIPTRDQRPFQGQRPSRLLWVAPGGDDGAEGTRARPLRSITEAVGRAGPGTAILVREGTYVENVELDRGGTETAPLWLVSADGPGAAHLRPADPALSTVYGFGERNIVIHGFRIDAGEANGIHLGMAGTDFGRTVANIVIQANHVSGAGADGIKVSQGDNIHVLDNVVAGAGDQGIDFVAVNHAVIDGNDISGVTGVAGLFVKGGSTGVRVSCNRIRDVDVDGLLVGGWTETRWMRPGFDGYEARRVVAEGNTVSGTGKRPLNILGAVEVRVVGNRLGGGSDQHPVVNVGPGPPWRTPPLLSRDVAIEGNRVDRAADWLLLEPGNADDVAEWGNGPTPRGAACP